ncbi:MAG TPA: zf-HC2 domain-containing protein, partial [bacterium]|nr:zf-HC2 domain-containing protein [bacterium]
MEGSRHCEMNLLFVEQFADGELPFKESAELSAHVASCAECRAHFDATRRLKLVLRATVAAERLTAIERGGLEKLIADTAARHRTVRERIADLFASPYPLAALSASVALAAVIGVFLHQLFTIERSADLIAREILHIHETTLPDEFSTAGDIETVVKRGLDLPVARIGRLVADRPVTKARFGTIGTRPMASLHMTGPTGNGTLLVARHNDALREVR